MITSDFVYSCLDDEMEVCIEALLDCAVAAYVARNPLQRCWIEAEHKCSSGVAEALATDQHSSKCSSLQLLCDATKTDY